MRYRYVLSSDFLTFSSVNVRPGVGDAATGFPAARIRDWQRPSRTWRSAGKPVSSLSSAFAANAFPPDVGFDSYSVVLLNTNLRSVGLQFQNARSNVIEPVPARAFTIDADPRDGRRNLVATLVSDRAALVSGGVSAATVWLARAGTPTAYWEIGAMFGISEMTELGANPRSPTTMRLVKPQQRGGSRDYPEEVNAGPAYLTDEWDVLTDDAAELARWRAFARLGPDDAVLWDYRDGGLYLMRPTRIDIEEGAHIHRIRAFWRQIV